MGGGLEGCKKVFEISDPLFIYLWYNFLISYSNRDNYNTRVSPHLHIYQFQNSTTKAR